MDGRCYPASLQVNGGPVFHSGAWSGFVAFDTPGLTLAELALYCNEVLKINADVHVVPMQGWRREMSWNETGRTWSLPSPNLPRIEGVISYPGMVLLEGTNLSEGRGTTIPFEIVGAPYLDADQYCDELQAFELPGVVFRPVQFKPTFDKWAGEICDGVALHHHGQAREIAQRIIDSIALPYDIAGRTDHTRASVGIAYSGGRSAERLVEEADLAMYRAKKTAKGTFREFEPDMRPELPQAV